MVQRRRRRVRDVPRREPEPFEALSPMAGIVDEVLADQPREVVDGEDTGLSAKERALRELEAKQAEMMQRERDRAAQADEMHVPRALRKYLG